MPPWCNSRNILFGHVFVRLRGELLVGQVWPHVITIYSSPTGLPRVCLGIICLEIYKEIYPIVLRLPTDCLETASGLPLDYKRPAFALPGVCLGIAQRLPWDCLGAGNGSQHSTGNVLGDARGCVLGLPGHCQGIRSHLNVERLRSDDFLRLQLLVPHSE